MDGGLAHEQTQTDAVESYAPLAQRLVRRDPVAFDELVALYQPHVLRIVHRLTGWGGRHDVEDIVEEVFLSALRHAPGFQGRSSLSTWLTAIAVNKCRSHHRRLAVLWKRLVHTPATELEVSSEGGAVGDALLGGETSARVRWAVQALSARDREVVVLRYFDELSLDEIAAMTGQSKNAVEVRLHRARARLAKALQDVLEED